jgi:hypothetical protein
MERQAGLGRSLEDVLDSLTPVEPDPAAPGRVLFEPEDIEQQLDQLMGDIAALRARVQHLVGLVPEDVVFRVVPDPGSGEEHQNGAQNGVQNGVQPVEQHGKHEMMNIKGKMDKKKAKKGKR